MKRKIGIIIPVMNLSWMTINLLESLKDTVNMKEVHPIVIDNGSISNESLAVLNWLKDNWKGEMTHDIHPEPLGFVGAVNIGFEFCREEKMDYVFIMNNDTIVTKGWIYKLLESLEDEKVGLVGPVSSPPEWRKLPMGKSFIEQKLKYHQVKNALNSYAGQLNTFFSGTALEKDFLAFYCVGMRMSTLQDIGQLDPVFGIGLFDDDDYCHRVMQKGYKIILRQDVYVHHYHNSTFLEHFGQKKYQALLAKNKQVFKEKWGFDPWERRIKNAKN